MQRDFSFCKFKLAILCTSLLVTVHARRATSDALDLVHRAKGTTGKWELTRHILELRGAREFARRLIIKKDQVSKLSAFACSQVKVL